MSGSKPENVTFPRGDSRSFGPLPSTFENQGAVLICLWEWFHFHLNPFTTAGQQPFPAGELLRAMGGRFFFFLFNFT